MKEFLMVTNHVIILRAVKSVYISSVNGREIVDSVQYVTLTLVVEFILQNYTKL